MSALPSVRAFRADLLEAGLLLATDVQGLYCRSGTFEAVARGVEGLASRSGADHHAPMFYFPPVMARQDFERTDYLRSFPDLIGSIDTFVGDDRDHAALLQLADNGGDWTQALAPAEVVLSPAACHALYANLRGQRLAADQVVECQAFVFRHEPSVDPARMQAFRMHEFVYLGSADGAVAHRALWLDRGLSALGGLGLEVEAVVANDPFFGRAGRMLAANQRETTLKYEITAHITADGATALASANYHQDHFGGPFRIANVSGNVAHTACFGFGIERIALALLGRHGFDPLRWPTEVRSRLWPGEFNLRDTSPIGSIDVTQDVVDGPNLRAEVHSARADERCQ